MARWISSACHKFLLLEAGKVQSQILGSVTSVLPAPPVSLLDVQNQGLNANLLNQNLWGREPGHWVLTKSPTACDGSLRSAATSHGADRRWDLPSAREQTPSVRFAP